MKLAVFCHSLLSDWNHRNAHFLRGIGTECFARGSEALFFEPAEAWSLKNLLRDHGPAALREFNAYHPALSSRRYLLETFDFENELEGCNLILVHEWNEPELVRKVGEYRRRHPECRLLFHDTHHRAISAPETMARYQFRDYDGVLASGASLRDAHIAGGWASRAWTWHEAADVRVFRPRPEKACRDDLVWIGNASDEGRSQGVEEFLVAPVKALGLRACAYGVRYSNETLRQLRSANIEYGSWIPGFRVPEIYSRYCLSVHIPKAAYTRMIPGIAITGFVQTLACGLPLVSAPWDDCEGLFRPGHDFLFARDGQEARKLYRDLLADPGFAREIGDNGRKRVLERHTCAHRVDQLIAIAGELGLDVEQQAA